jgi:hypothetical protein
VESMPISVLKVGSYHNIDRLSFKGFLSRFGPCM